LTRERGNGTDGIWIEKPHSDQGRPRCPTETVVEILQFFLHEGVQWRELRAIEHRVCGATLRRRLHEWSVQALLHRVHAALVRMVRSGPEAAAAAWDVVIDSCSVRAKRGGELTGPNPTDRAKRGSKYHVIVASDGIPLAALPSAANVNDTMLLPALLRRALVVCAAIARLYADAAHHSAENRRLCTAEGILALIRDNASHTAPGWALFAASSSTPMPGCSPTSASIAARTD
jgi:hypothetical protein